MAPPNPAGPSADQSVEYHFTHRVTPDQSRIFLQCQGELKALARTYPGFIHEESTALQAEGDVLVSETLIRFDSLENLLGWIDSPARRKLISLQENTGYQFAGKVNIDGYARWLQRRLNQPSPTWKINLLVLLVLYPTVMGLNLLLQKPQFVDFSTWMLFSNFCSVAITGWWAVPWVSNIYQRWLQGEGSKKEQRWALLSIIIALLVWLQFFRMVSPLGAFKFPKF